MRSTKIAGMHLTENGNRNVSRTTYFNRAVRTKHERGRSEDLTR
jgi:hypothetical protein